MNKLNLFSRQYQYKYSVNIAWIIGSITTYNIILQYYIICVRPETQAYIQKLEQEKIEKAKGQQADNRGFFAKYVSYIAYCICAVAL